MLKTDPETMRKTKKIQADKYQKSLILNRVKENICKIIQKIRNSQVKWKKEEKKNVCVVDDSMLKNITGSGLSKDHTVKIRPHPGATTVDMIDYIKPELRHKPNIIILH